MYPGAAIVGVVGVPGTAGLLGNWGGTPEDAIEIGAQVTLDGLLDNWVPPPAIIVNKMLIYLCCLFTNLGFFLKKNRFFITVNPDWKFFN